MEKKLMLIGLIGGILFTIFFIPLKVSAQSYETYGGIETWTQFGEDFDRYTPASQQWEIHDAYVNTGDMGNTAIAKYYANLSIGAIGAYSYAANAYDADRKLYNGADANSVAYFKDTIYFTVPAGYYEDDLEVTVGGNIAGYILTEDVAAIGTWCTGGTSWAIKFKRLTGPGTPEDIFSHYEQCEEGETYSIDETFAVTIPIVDAGTTLGEASIITTSLYAHIGNGTVKNYAIVTASSESAEAEAHFFNSLEIQSLTLPEDITWESASGVFLNSDLSLGWCYSACDCENLVSEDPLLCNDCLGGDGKCWQPVEWDSDDGHYIAVVLPYKTEECGGFGCDKPIAVELSSFTAMAGHGKVILNWTTQTETENLGYQIYRSLVEDGEFAKRTTALIKGAGSSDEAHSYSYTDPDVEAGNTYYYKLADVDFNGNMAFHGPISVTVEAATPTKYALEQSYPNPFNPETAINFSIKEAGKVSLKIYNLQGQLIRSLVDEDKLAGSYSVIWNGTNDQGIRVSSGTYLYTLKVNEFEDTKKLMFMK